MKFNIEISLQSLRKYMKYKLHYTTKKNKPLNFRVDFHNSLLQRQYAASKFIEYLTTSKTIINIDESTLNKTNYNESGLQAIGEKLYTTGSKRIDSFNIIAGVSNKNEVYFTLNLGSNNSSTFKLFLSKLVTHLSKANSDWRNSTMLLIDNASFHKSREVLEYVRRNDIPLMFLGPY